MSNYTLSCKIPEPSLCIHPSRMALPPNTLTSGLWATLTHPQILRVQADFNAAATFPFLLLSAASYAEGTYQAQVVLLKLLWLRSRWKVKQQQSPKKSSPKSLLNNYHLNPLNTFCGWWVSRVVIFLLKFIQIFLLKIGISGISLTWILYWLFCCLRWNFQFNVSQK